MSVNEHDRRVLHQALVGLIGELEADTLMELLPPAGWTEIARKQDLETLELRLRAAFHRDMVQQTWIFVGTMLAGLGALAALVH